MTRIARAILAVPPFPGSRPHAVVVPAAPGEVDAATQISAADFIAALRSSRVGGPFWETPQNHDPFATLPDAPADQVALEAFVGDHLLRGIACRNPFTGDPIAPLALIEILAGWRRLIDANRPIAAAFGFAAWKQDTVDPLLWGGASVPFLPARQAALAQLPPGAAVAVWKARVPADFLAALEAGPWTIVEVEDGFIRSVGLGADCVPPLSIVVDDLGVHYDPVRPNRLEAMLAADPVPPGMLERARALGDWLVREGVSKYGVSTKGTLPRPGGSRRHILVVGQVEDDRSLLFGGGEIRTNIDLLQRVRALEPDAHLVYRPHPDVESGHRKGAIPPAQARAFADSIDPASPIGALIAMVDEVHVMTSLAGFEALLQCKPVTTYGIPFFAGWGLTQDRATAPAGRDRSLTRDELIAAVLLAYPRYLDPVTSLPCTPEILVMRLLSGVRRQNDALVPMRRLLGRMHRATRRMLAGS